MLNDPLNQAFDYFINNPPPAQNRAQRRHHMAAIQAAADNLTPETFQAYYQSWLTDPMLADHLEADPTLTYLRRATDRAVKQIQSTKVTRGLVAWHLYNMGYVFKTHSACFAIDIFLRNAARLADALDFLLITHPHPDHLSPDLTDALLAQNKPVITSWDPQTTVIPLDPNVPRREIKLKNLTIKIDVGDHQQRPEQHNNMLMFQIDCGEDANNFCLYHSGDGCNFYKMKPDRPLDLFIVHTGTGNMKVENAIAHLHPKFTLVSHMMELAHSPHPPHDWRFPFDFAFNTIKNTPPEKADLLTWGERWLAPRTQLAKQTP